MDKSNKKITPFMHRIIVATLILLFIIVYYFDISSLKNSQDKLLVNPIIWIVILLYPIIIWQEWREKKKNEAVQQEDVTEKEIDEDDETSARLSKKVLLFMIFTLAYLILLNYVGFIVSTIIYMPALMSVLGTKSKKILIILPIATTVILYILFNNLLGIPLPEGVLLQGVL